MHFERHFVKKKNGSGCLPYLKFSDLLPQTHFSTWPDQNQVFHLHNEYIVNMERPDKAAQLHSLVNRTH